MVCGAIDSAVMLRTDVSRHPHTFQLSSPEAADTRACQRRPQRLVLLAIDGVAPHAKLKQQRTRRFMAAYTEGLRATMEEEVEELLVQALLLA